MPSMREIGEAMIAGDIPPPPVARLVGFTMKEFGDGRAVFELEATEDHANPMATLHGGIICDVADGAMGMAYATTLGEGESFTTLEIRTSFLRPFWTGRLIAEAEVVSRGRTVGLVECEVHDADGRLIAKSSTTQMTLRGDQAKGR